MEHTHEVIVASERLLSAVQNTEMSQRNFLITQEAQFVQEWEAASGEVWRRLATLRVLIQVPEEQQRLTELERLIAARLQRLAHGLDIARANDFEEALASVRDGDGNRLMQDVREALDVIVADENRLLGKRRAAADTEQHQLNEQFRLVTGAGVVLFVLFGGALAALVLMRARAGRELAIAAERLKGEAALRASEARLRRFIDAAPVAIAMFDREMRYIAASRRFITDLPERWREIHQRCLQGAVESSAGERFARADGTLDWIRWEIQPWHDNRGAIGGIALFSEDITDRKQAEEALFHEKERAQVTLQSIGDAVITTDKQSRVEYLNPVAEAMTGWSCLEAAGQPLTTVFRIINEQNRTPAADPVSRCLAHGNIVPLANHTNLVSREGKERSIADSAAPIRDRDGAVLGAVLVFRDVSETRRLARQLAHEAAHDALTGLVNRREFEQRLERAVASAQRHRLGHALCYFDLDQFKLVNDTAGHAAGDALLKQVRGLLAGKFRERDTLARLGGDEFALLLENCELNEACRIAEGIVAAFREWQFTWAGRAFQIGISAGVVAVTPNCKNAQQLLTEADVACYTAKEQGRNRVYVYRKDGAHPSPHHAQMLMASSLRDALAANQFCLYGQPIVSLSEGNGIRRRYEVLLRMVGRDHGIVLPGTFIPAAERYGLMAAIDRWIIENAFRAYAALDGSSDRAQIAINLSGDSLSTDDLAQFVLHQFATHNIRSERVCFEITETAAIQNLDHALQFIGEIKARGGRFALDDFGSGLSSFRYLRELPADYLKIDGSFVCNMSRNAHDQAVVAAINEVGHTLGIDTIAEHAHDAATVGSLRQMGVDYAQGYAFGAPAPLEQLLGVASGRAPSRPMSSTGR